MSTTRESIVKWLYIKCDLLSVLAAWVLAYYLRFYGPIEASKGIPLWLSYIKLTPFILVIWLSVFSFSGLYERGKFLHSSFDEWMRIFRACFISIIVFVAVTYFYDEYHYSRLTLMLFAILHPVFIVLGRSGLRKILRVYRRRYPSRRVLFLGGGPNLDRAFEIAGSFDLTSQKLVGILGISTQEEGLQYSKRLAKQLNCPYFDLPTDWIDFFHKHSCETIFVALENHSNKFFVDSLELIAEQVPDIKVIPDLSYLDQFNSGIDWVGKSLVVNVHESPLKGIGQLQKRVFDIFGSLICLLIFSPLLLLISLLVKLSSPGKVLYTQERMGLDGRSFPIFKFRTMPENAESSSGAIWASKEDGRASGFGKWLRKTSLDELPQLFNVLIGHMSLVGPRPERPVFVAQFRRSVPGYMLRHKVKAGMTGWAQVQGWRGNTSIEKRIESDLYYIQNWSLWFDIRILWLTLFKGFVNTNAY
jgi:Undecaprenyl-phosphate glucose phosphotransferase